MFTFMKMHKSGQGVYVTPFNFGDVRTFYGHATKFALRDARCFNDEDRERLVGVIESAFGDYRKFEHAVRQMLRRRHCGSDVQSWTSAHPGTAHGLDRRQKS